MPDVGGKQPEIVKKWKVFDEGLKTAANEGAFEWKPNTWYSFQKLEGQGVKGFSCYNTIPEILQHRQDHWEILALVECFNEYSDGAGKKFYESVKILRAWHWKPEDSRSFALACGKLLLKNLKDPKELLALGVMIKLNERVNIANQILEKKTHFLNEAKRLETSAIIVDDLSSAYRRYWDTANELRTATPEISKLALIIWQRTLQLFSGNKQLEEELERSAHHFHESLVKYNFQKQ
jgi:hypothetical protein